MSRKQANKAQSQAQTATQGQKDAEVSYDIVTVDSWNIKSHDCGAAKPNKSGQGKSAPFTYGGRRFFLKVPKMYCPFGASKPKPKPNEKEPENPSWSLQMAFGDDPQCQLFQKKANEFDAFMIDEGAKPDNCIGWLGASKSKLFSREVVESKYTGMVKYSKKDGEINPLYPPFIRAQFPTTFKPPYEFTCEIYDSKNNLLDVSVNPLAPNSITKVIPSGVWCSALLSGSIWCSANGYGVTWRIAQLKVFPSKGLPKGKCLVGDPSDEDDSEESGETSSDEHGDSNQNGTQVENGSAEDVDIEEVVEGDVEGDVEEPLPAKTVQTTSHVQTPPTHATTTKPKRVVGKKQ